MPEGIPRWGPAGMRAGSKARLSTAQREAASGRQRVRSERGLTEAFSSINARGQTSTCLEEMRDQVGGAGPGPGCRDWRAGAKSGAVVGKPGGESGPGTSKRRCFPQIQGPRAYRKLSGTGIMGPCPKLPRSRRLSRAPARPLPSPPVRESRCRRSKRQRPPSLPPERLRKRRQNFSSCGPKQ